MNELREYTAMARRKSFQVMSVWGIAGVGKSSLVRNLYSERILQQDQLFYKYGWVSVSHPFSLRDFSWSLLSDFQSSTLQGMGNRDPIHECCKLLKELRCLVIIDDLKSTEEWDLIQASLISRPSESVVIAITTDASIATHCADNEELVFNVKGLEAEAAINLFRKEVFRKKPSSPLKDSNDEEIRELVLKCGGIPTVIVAIADFLAPKTVTWMDTANSMNTRFMHELETNPEFASLQDLFGWMHSYFRTCPDFLKPCIFYLSIFPRDHSIRRRRLVRRWIAEGYSRDTDSNSAEERGEMFFSKLLDLSIIQHPPHSVTTTSNDTRMVLCQVNRFVREYIISRRMEENLVFELGGSCTLTTQRTGRHLVIWKSWDRDRIVFESIDFSRLRSLTVFGNWKSFLISNRMKLLRVLDLEDASGVTDKDLEHMLEVLSRLKFLSLRACSEVTRLPNSLGDLRQLQSLDVQGTSIVALPAAITKLQKLQYVRAGTTVPLDDIDGTVVSPSPKDRHGVEVPRRIGKLTLLHTLGVVNVGSAGGKAILKDIRKLTQLRKLGVSGINTKNSKDFFSAISGYRHLESLSVQVDKENQGCLDDIPLSTENIQSLKLYGHADKMPALWTNQLSNLTKLDLEMAILRKNDIEVIGSLPKLFSLSVKTLQGGELIFCVTMSGLEEFSCKKVKVFEITCSSRLQVTFGSKTMQNLELLRVGCCSGSSLKFSGLKNLRELKEVLIKGTYDDNVRQDLQNLLAEHPKKPALKSVKQCSS